LGKSLEDLVSGGWRVSEEKVKRVALEVRIMGSLQDCFDMDIEALSVLQ
jgi:hypothetical protein